MNKLKTSIFISVAMSGLAFAVILPILAPLIRELRLSESQGGAMISIGALVMTLMGAIWGAYSDRVGRKPVIVIGFAGLFVGYVLYTSTAWFGLINIISGTLLFALLVVTRAIVGGFMPAIMSGAQALMADNTSTAERSSGMALISAANGVGLIIGPAIGGGLALMGLIWPLVLTTILCLSGGIYALINLPKAPPRPHKKPEPVNPFEANVWPWLLTGLITFAAILTIQISAGFYFQDRLELTTAQTGPMLAVALTMVGLALLLTQVLQMKLLHWSSRTMVLVGAPLWIIGLVILLLTRSAETYYGAYALFGVGAGFLMPAYMSGASLAVPKQHQGAVAGLTAAVQGIGAIIAPLGSTLLYELDQTLPFWFIIALMVGIWALFAIKRPNQFAEDAALQADD